MSEPTVFLLSPARVGGKRTSILLREDAEFALAQRLREGTATLGEVFAFLSGLYFRGKLAYMEAFGRPPAGVASGLVIVPGGGLRCPQELLSRDELIAMGGVDVHEANERYREPLLRDASELAARAGPGCRFVLLGSVATEKYIAPLQAAIGERIYFPSAFAGRGDMSRGGLMLRCARAGEELEYAEVTAGPRRGRRPAKLPRI